MLKYYFGSSNRRIFCKTLHQISEAQLWRWSSLLVSILSSVALWQQLLCFGTPISTFLPTSPILIQSSSSIFAVDYKPMLVYLAYLQEIHGYYSKFARTKQWLANDQKLIWFEYRRRKANMKQRWSVCSKRRKEHHRWRLPPELHPKYLVYIFTGLTHVPTTQN